MNKSIAKKNEEKAIRRNNLEKKNKQILKLFEMGHIKEISEEPLINEDEDHTLFI